MSDTYLQHLHDQATRGASLSDEERAALDAWYARQDQSENEVLARATSAITIPELQHQLDTALRQLRAVAQHIRETATVNNDLRREIGQLQLQLAQRSSERTL